MLMQVFNQNGGQADYTAIFTASNTAGSSGGASSGNSPSSSSSSGNNSNGSSTGSTNSGNSGGGGKGSSFPTWVIALIVILVSCGPPQGTLCWSRPCCIMFQQHRSQCGGMSLRSACRIPNELGVMCVIERSWLRLQVLLLVGLVVGCCVWRKCSKRRAIQEQEFQAATYFSNSKCVFFASFPGLPSFSQACHENPHLRNQCVEHRQHQAYCSLSKECLLS